MPYDAITGDVDTAAVSADGATYTDAKYMTVIVSGASGDIEGDDGYRKESPSYTGTENCAWERLCGCFCGCSGGLWRLFGASAESSQQTFKALSLNPGPSTVADGWGIFTPLNATHATWSFKTVKADNGPADYSDSLTFVQHSHVL